MKKAFGVMLAGVVLLGGVAAFAGDGCCAAGSATKATDCFAKLNLTAQQKAKVEALQAECKTNGCTATAYSKLAAGLKAILTPDQYTQWTAACEQAKGATAGGKCPFSSKPKAEHTESKN